MKDKISNYIGKREVLLFFYLIIAVVGIAAVESLEARYKLEHEIELPDKN